MPRMKYYNEDTKQWEDADSADGGYYLPSVTQPESGAMQISFAASKAGMPPVAPVVMELPVGSGNDSGQNRN